MQQKADTIPCPSPSSALNYTPDPSNYRRVKTAAWKRHVEEVATASKSGFKNYAKFRGGPPGERAIVFFTNDAVPNELRTNHHAWSVWTLLPSMPYVRLIGETDNLYSERMRTIND